MSDHVSNQRLNKTPNPHQNIFNGGLITEAVTFVQLNVYSVIMTPQMISEKNQNTVSSVSYLNLTVD